jgi:hypothetical protein
MHVQARLGMRMHASKQRLIHEQVCKNARMHNTDDVHAMHAKHTVLLSTSHAYGMAGYTRNASTYSTITWFKGRLEVGRVKQFTLLQTHFRTQLKQQGTGSWDSSAHANITFHCSFTPQAHLIIM